LNRNTIKEKQKSLTSQSPTTHQNGRHLSKLSPPPTPSFRNPVKLDLKPLPNRCTELITERRGLICRYVGGKIREEVKPDVQGILGWHTPSTYRMVHRMGYELEKEIKLAGEEVLDLESGEGRAMFCATGRPRPVLTEFVHWYCERKMHAPKGEQW
jgi:hypothetical protein